MYHARQPYRSSADVVGGVRNLNLSLRKPNRSTPLNSTVYWSRPPPLPICVTSTRTSATVRSRTNSARRVSVRTKSKSQLPQRRKMRSDATGGCALRGSVHRQGQQPASHANGALEQSAAPGPRQTHQQRSVAGSDKRVTSSGAGSALRLFGPSVFTFGLRKWFAAPATTRRKRKRDPELSVPCSRQSRWLVPARQLDVEAGGNRFVAVSCTADGCGAAEDVIGGSFPHGIRFAFRRALEHGIDDSAALIVDDDGRSHMDGRACRWRGGGDNSKCGNHRSERNEHRLDAGWSFTKMLNCGSE
jgi:hypothetical protein